MTNAKVSLLNRSFSSRYSGQRPSKKRCSSLEALEQRTLFSTTLWWTGEGANDNWNNAANWGVFSGGTLTAALVAPLTNAYDVAFFEGTTATVDVNVSPTIAAIYLEGDSHITLKFMNATGGAKTITVEGDSSKQNSGNVVLNLLTGKTTELTTTAENGTLSLGSV